MRLSQTWSGDDGALHLRFRTALTAIGAARLPAKTAIPACFAENFRRSHILFLGYGLKDWNLRVILHQVWKEWPRRRYASWAIQHKADRLEQEFWALKRLKIFEMSIADFLVKLDRSPDVDG